MGLLKTGAKAYVATRVVGSTRRRQQQRWAAADQAAAAQTAGAPAPAQPAEAAPEPAAAGSSMLDQLAQLGQLRDAGVLTDAEFETQKQRILDAG